MQLLLKHVERMTRGCDRPQLEISLVEALYALLDADSVCLHKLEAAPDETFIWPAVSTGRNGTSLYDDGLSLPEDMISTEDYPLMSVCLASGKPQFAGRKSIFPALKTDDMLFGFIEIVGAPLDPMQIATVQQLLAIFRNMIALLDYSEIDTLTGLLNRKTFDVYLLNILSSLSAGDDTRLETHRQPKRRRSHAAVGNHWLGVVDIDHFKRVNDNFGHLIGDEVLLLLATMMKESFRTHDKLFRFGGEEFVVLLKPTETDNAQAAFDRFRLQVEQREFPQVGHVTVSIGYARILPFDQPSVIIDHADEALYWVKEHGRNQVVNYETLIVSGELIERKDADDNVEFF